jgi:hypothetical protein
LVCFTAHINRGGHAARRGPPRFDQSLALASVTGFLRGLFCVLENSIPGFFARRSRAQTHLEDPLSHIVTIETQVRDPAAIAAACRRLGLPPPIQRTVKLFSDSATGLAVELPGWNYPVVCDVASGSLKFDNYEGAWGSQQELAKFLQSYAIEKARIEAHRKGYSVQEQALTDGSIKLTIQVTGGAP